MRWLLAALLLVPTITTASLCGCSGPQDRRAENRAETSPWPEDYTTWTRLNDAPIFLESERTARNLYVNATALARSGGDGASFPVGSILVKEEHRLVANPQGRLKVGDVFRVSVMFKVGRGETSGWAFKAFDPQTRREFPRDRVDPDGCYFCHADASARDYVFSRIR